MGQHVHQVIMTTHVVARWDTAARTVNLGRGHVTDSTASMECVLMTTRLMKQDVFVVQDISMVKHWFGLGQNFFMS